MSEEGPVPSHQGNKTQHSAIFSFVLFQDKVALEGCLAKAEGAAEVSLGAFCDIFREAAAGQDLGCPCSTLLPRLEQQNRTSTQLPRGSDGQEWVQMPLPMLFYRLIMHSSVGQPKGSWEAKPCPCQGALVWCLLSPMPADVIVS